MPSPSAAAYVLGASNASFLLVLAVHHEVQYLYFTYAMARRSDSFHAVSKTGIEPAMQDLDSRVSYEARTRLRTETKACGFFSRLACDRICRSHCRRLVRTRMAGSARHGRTFLSLLARWSHLDETVVSKLTRGKTCSGKCFQS